MSPSEPETVEDARGGVYAEMKHRVMCERRAGDPDWVTEEQCTCLLPSLLDEYEAAVRRDERERTTERERVAEEIESTVAGE